MPPSTFLTVKFRPKFPVALIAICTLVWLTGASGQDAPAADAGVKPPPAESFEQPAPGSAPKTDASNFRYTYPVRDSGSNEVYTEKPPKAPSGRSQTPASAEYAQSGNTDPAEFEMVGSGGTGGGAPDIGEGIYERRPYRFSFALYEGYNSNVNTAQNNGVASMYTQVSAGVGYDFGTSRLKLSTSLSAAMVFYYDNAGLDNDGLFPTVNFVLGANYAATPRLDLSFSTTTGLYSTGNYSTAGAPNSFQGSYILSDTSFGAKYLWLPKLATETIYNPRIYYFVDQGYNDTQGRVEQTVSQQFLFLWKPTTTLVAEYRFDTRNYYTATDLNSVGNYALLGFDHTLNPRSTLTARAGVEQRFNQNPTPTQGGSNIYLGPFAQMNFNYAAGKNTILALQARYGTTASGLSNYNQGQQLLLGINASHQFTRRIAANAFLNYQNNYYNQPDSTVDGIEVAPSFSDNVYNAGINASFKVNRVISLLAGYTYSTLISGNTIQQRNYTQNIAYIGAEFDF